MACLDTLKSLTIDSGTSFVRCDQDRAIYLNCDVANLSTSLNMTIDRVDRIIREFVDIECLNYVMSRAKIPQHAVQGWTALTTFTLMLGTLWVIRRKLGKCTLILQAATAIFEFPIAVNNIAIGHLWAHAEELYYMRLYNFAYWLMLYSGNMIGDMFKLTLSCLTFCISLERFVAVCFPRHVRKISNPTFACSAVLFSVAVGSAHMWPAFGLYLSPKADGTWATVGDPIMRTDTYKSFYNVFISRFTVYARIVFCACDVVMSVGTVIGVKKLQHKVRDWTSEGQAEEEKMRKLVKLSVTMSVCVIIDHVPWIANTFWGWYGRDNSAGNVYTMLVNKFSDEQIATRAYSAHIDLALYHLSVWAQWFLHGIRFLVYLAFNKTIRDGFLQMVRIKK